MFPCWNHGQEWENLQFFKNHGFWPKITVVFEANYSFLTSKTVFFLWKPWFLVKTAGFGPKTTDLGINTCENTFSFTFELGANRYTSIFILISLNVFFFISLNGLIIQCVYLNWPNFIILYPIDSFQDHLT